MQLFSSKIKKILIFSEMKLSSPKIKKLTQSGQLQQSREPINSNVI